MKRIFRELGTTFPSGSNFEQGDGSLLPPDVMSVDRPYLENPSSDAAVQPAIIPALFDNLPPELQALSIASFLKAHPAPLTPDQLLPLSITNADFQLALLQVQPSSKREGFTTVPDVTWSNIGALSAIREELRMAIVQPIKYPEVFQAIGISAPCGVLLWGPPGCGKTLLAKAVANESSANFISVKGPELLNKVNAGASSARKVHGPLTQT